MHSVRSCIHADCAASRPYLQSGSLCTIASLAAVRQAMLLRAPLSNPSGLLDPATTWGPAANAASRSFLQPGWPCFASLQVARQEVRQPGPTCSPPGSAASRAYLLSGIKLCFAYLTVVRQAVHHRLTTSSPPGGAGSRPYLH